MGIVLKSEREAWGREGGDKVEAVAAWESDTGVGEIVRDRGHSAEWDLKGTRAV